MAKGMYFGVGGVPRKVSKMYFGVGGVPRKVKKVFFGVGGSPRLAYSADLSYVGLASPLTVAEDSLEGASNPSYALFTNGTATDSGVDAYSASLVHTMAPRLNTASFLNHKGTNIGDYAMFGGGKTSGGSRTLVIVCYNSALARSTVNMIAPTRCYLGAASNPNYALFGGGEIDDQPLTQTSVMDAFNASLTRVTAPDLSNSRRFLTGLKFGNYAVFAGGRYSSTYRAEVDAYDTSLSRYTITPLSVAGYNISKATNSAYAIFAGGEARPGAVDAYNTSFVRNSNISLRTGLHDEGASISTPDFAIFAGGDWVATPSYQTWVDCFDTNLVRSDGEPLSFPRFDAGGASIGNYALVAGGYNINSNPTYRTEVDVYEF